MKLQFRVLAEKNTLFDDHAFDRNVGKLVDVKDFGKAKVLKAEVVNGGKSALITINTIKRILPRGQHYERRDND